MKNLYSDDQLIALLASTDRREVDAAMTQLHRQYKDMVVRLVRQNSGTGQDAEEVLSDTLVGLWKAVRTSRYQPAAQLKTYLYQIARNLCLKRIRDASREIDLTDTEPLGELQLAGANEAFEDTELVEAYWAKIRAMGETCYNVLWAFAQGYSMQEIAVEFGLGTANNAKTIKYNCLKKAGRP